MSAYIHICPHISLHFFVRQRDQRPIARVWRSLLAWTKVSHNCCTVFATDVLLEDNLTTYASFQSSLLFPLSSTTLILNRINLFLSLMWLLDASVWSLTNGDGTTVSNYYQLKLRDLWKWVRAYTFTTTLVWIGSTLEIEPSKIMDEISVRGLGIRWYVDQSSPNYRILKQKILIAQNLCVWEPR